MDIMKKIKDAIDGKNRRKLIENTAIVIVVGVIVIIAGGTIFSGGKSNATQKEQKKDVNTTESQQNADSRSSGIEARLAALLSQMKGVGKVDVMVTFSTTRENIPAYDTKRNQSSTDEKDSAGGTRSISQEEYDSTLAYEDSSSGGKKPVILKELEPEVKGVLVVADGADSVEVRERICNAVTVVLDIPVHRIQVVQRKK